MLPRSLGTAFQSGLVVSGKQPHAELQWIGQSARSPHANFMVAGRNVGGQGELQRHEFADGRIGGPPSELREQALDFFQPGQLRPGEPLAAFPLFLKLVQLLLHRLLFHGLQRAVVSDDFRARQIAIHDHGEIGDAGRKLPAHRHQKCRALPSAGGINIADVRGVLCLGGKGESEKKPPKGRLKRCFVGLEIPARSRGVTRPPDISGIRY